MTAHMCRHNYCTRLCYEIPKISTKKIAELMGDTEQMVLKVYLRFAPPSGHQCVCRRTLGGGNGQRFSQSLFVQSLRCSVSLHA